MKTAAQAAANWQASAGRATTAYSQGVQSYTGDWAGRTTQQQAALVQGFNEAVSSGRWAQGVQATGTQGWKSATEAKAANFGVGFNAGAQKQAAAAQKIMGALGNIVGSLPPRGDFNQNVQRSVQVQTQLHALKGQLGA